MPLSSPGLGSGLDVATMVSQLVAAERAPVQDRITRDQKRIDTQISALGSLKGGLSSLESALSALNTEAAFQTRSAVSSDAEILTASATSSAAPGQYEVEVVRLATAHKLASGPFLGGSISTVGTGTLTISVGDESFDVSIDSEHATLGAIRDAINAASDNVGVRATVIQADDGARLVLAGTQTGAENAIRITATGGDGGLTSLVYDPGVLTNLEELSEARDALVRIEGFERSSATNTISNALDGVTLTLLKETAPDEPLTLTVNNDAKSATERVKKFVTAFNGLANAIGALRAYNPDTRVAGPLLGDAMLRGIESELRNLVSDSVSGAVDGYESLAMIGVTTNPDGTLKLDETKLANAFAANFDAVGKLFGSADGVGARLHAAVTKHVGDEAVLTKRAEALQSGKREIATRTEALDARMEIVQQRYLKQFTALDTLLAQMQSTSNYLLQQLSNL
jgi:flagellar hook-associated protein 2